MSARTTRSSEEEVRLLHAQSKAKKIISDRKNVTEPGAGYFVVRIPGGRSVSGHFDELLHHVTQALMSDGESTATA